MCSPHHHLSNGKVESAVKIVKKIFAHAFKTGKDPLLCLLEWRNTPTEGFTSSPVQRFMSRRTRTPLVLNTDLLTPNVETNIHVQLVRSKRQ